MKNLLLSAMAAIMLMCPVIACGQSVVQAAHEIELNNIRERILHARAIETAIWGIPLVNFDRMLQAMIHAAKGGENQIVYWSKPADWKNQTLTPNSDNLYMMPFYNTEHGPMVLEIPAADEGVFVGSVMTCWHMPMEDVGPAGADGGKGGKYLLLPPDYCGEIPQGYIVLQMNTYQGYALLRSNPRSHAPEDIRRAADYMKRVRLYPLSEEEKQPRTRLVDATGVLFDATIPYDIRFYESLNRVIQANPWIERDRSMIDVLAAVGIQKGETFAPDKRTVKILENAVQTARLWFKQTVETNGGIYPGTNWFNPATDNYRKALTSGFADPDIYPVDNRGFIFHLAYFSPKRVGASKNQMYVFTARDNNGRLLDGGCTYHLKVPANVPVRQFWSVTVYDQETHAFLKETPVTSISSLNKGVRTNEDGTVDIWFGPEAPGGKESNWIATQEGKNFEIIFRFYGAEKEALQRSWKLPDLEKVNP